jgi:hypothetical protein
LLGPLKPAARSLLVPDRQFGHGPRPVRHLLDKDGNLVKHYLYDAILASDYGNRKVWDPTCALRAHCGERFET